MSGWRGYEIEKEALELTASETETALWPEVSSSAARRVIETLASRLPSGGEALPELDELRGVLSRKYGYWLRDRLEQSGIAQRLPAGLEALPDIYAARGGVLGALGRLLRPRSPEQLALHVLDNLDWFLNPEESKGPELDSRSRLLLWAIGILLALVLIVLSALLAGRDGALLATFMSVALGWWLALRPRYTEVSQFVDLTAEGDPDYGLLNDPELQVIKPDIQAVELYRYLVHSYSDVEADGGLLLEVVGKLSAEVPAAELVSTLDERRAARRRLLGREDS